MPRGDHKAGCIQEGQPCKCWGTPRRLKKHTDVGEQPHRGLAARRVWFDGKQPGLTELNSRQKASLDNGQAFTRPGSQRKGKR